ncbi:MAG: hypothetical protein ACRECV_09285 [Xanthobacteraceae bacterium]
MAKKARRKRASKAVTKSKAPPKIAKTKAAANKKVAIAKQRRRRAGKAKKSKAVAQARPAPKTAVMPPRKTLVQRIEGAFTAVADILTDAEQLHHRLEPTISNEPE